MQRSPQKTAAKLKQTFKKEVRGRAVLGTAVIELDFDVPNLAGDFQKKTQACSKKKLSQKMTMQRVAIYLEILNCNTVD